MNGKQWDESKVTRDKGKFASFEHDENPEIEDLHGDANDPQSVWDSPSDWYRQHDVHVADPNDPIKKNLFVREDGRGLLIDGYEGDSDIERFENFADAMRNLGTTEAEYEVWLAGLSMSDYTDPETLKASGDWQAFSGFNGPDPDDSSLYADPKAWAKDKDVSVHPKMDETFFERTLRNGEENHLVVPNSILRGKPEERFANLVKDCNEVKEGNYRVWLINKGLSDTTENAYHYGRLVGAKYDLDYFFRDHSRSYQIAANEWGQQNGVAITGKWDDFHLTRTDENGKQLTLKVPNQVDPNRPIGHALSEELKKSHDIEDADYDYYTWLDRTGESEGLRSHHIFNDHVDNLPNVKAFFGDDYDKPMYNTRTYTDGDPWYYGDSDYYDKEGNVIE